MYQVTQEEAERTEHLEDCAGYEDCECFSMQWAHADIYEMQEKIRSFRYLLREARRFVLDDALMASAISRHAPLPAEAQCAHDTHETLSERLLLDIDHALGLQG